MWIHANANITLEEMGAPPGNTSIPLCAGWNLIGYPSAAPVPLPDALASIASKYTQVSTYDASDTADPWKRFDPRLPPFANDLLEMGPGRGYWVNVTEPATLVVTA